MSLIAPTLQAFFTDRLARQRYASPRTVASYRDTLRLLLCFVQATNGKAPSSLNWDDLDEGLISSFLEHLQTDRNNSGPGLPSTDVVYERAKPLFLKRDLPLPGGA